ncbi:GSCOCG00008622001-RA-CDS, partial [Cotesia congregata]
MAMIEDLKFGVVRKSVFYRTVLGLLQFIMVWVGVSRFRRTPLINCPSKFKCYMRYIDQILRPFVLP